MTLHDPIEKSNENEIQFKKFISPECMQTQKMKKEQKGSSGIEIC